MMTFILGALVWYLLGIWAVIFWVTEDEDFKVGDVFTLGFAIFPLIGPLFWLVVLKARLNPYKILVKKRERR